MYGPYQLTHVVYVLLVIAFVAAETYMIVYNLRMKRREKALKSSRHLGREETIAAGADAKRQENQQPRH